MACLRRCWGAKIGYAEEARDGAPAIRQRTSQHAPFRALLCPLAAALLLVAGCGASGARTASVKPGESTPQAVQHVCAQAPVAARDLQRAGPLHVVSRWPAF
jgi:hypothetical protein